MSPSILQCFCVCGRKNVIADGLREFTCECGRRSEVDWRAEIEQYEAREAK